MTEPLSLAPRIIPLIDQRSAALRTPEAAFISTSRIS
ncbi:MAG: hypothetical protein ACI9I0_001771, partial [Rhodoferax sp.]